MLRRSKRLFLAGLVAVGATTVLPAAPVGAAAAAPCQSRDIAKFQEYSHTALVTGQYAVAGAIDVRLTCGIVQNGVTVTRVTDKAVGPVAALAETVGIAGQWYSVCHEIVITRIEGVSTLDTCP